MIYKYIYYIYIRIKIETTNNFGNETSPNSSSDCHLASLDCVNTTVVSGGDCGP